MSSSLDTAAGHDKTNGGNLISQPALRHFFNASTGYRTLGYGLPEALARAIASRPLDAPLLIEVDALDWNNALDA